MISADERTTRRRDGRSARMVAWRWSHSLILVGVWWALLVPTVLSGCDEDRDPVQSQPAQAGKGSGEKIVLAVHPYASPVELTRQFAPLLEYLSQRTDKSFSLAVSQTYETHITRVGGNDVDIALMGPASYVTMTERFGKKRLLCCFEVSGSPEFHGYVIVRKDSSAASLADLQGKSFASSSRESTMSYVLPRYMFIQAKVPFPDAHLRVVGSHNNVCLNVLAGDVNAGGVREKAYDKYEARGLKIIAQSPGVTEHPFVATDSLDAEAFDRVRQALLAIKSPDDVKRLLTPIKATMTGLAPVEDKDYDPLRAIRAAVREDEKRAEQRGQPK